MKGLKKQEINTTDIVINSIESDILLKKLSLKYCSTKELKYNRYDYSEYDKLTAEIQEQLNTPFYFHTYSGLYTVFKESEKLTIKDSPVDFECFDSSDKVNKSLHVFIKVLLASYFYNQSEKDRRICQPNFYILANEREYNGKIYGSALEVQLGQDSDHAFKFNIKGRVKDIFKVDEVDPRYKSFAHYQEVSKNGLTYLRRVKRSEIDKTKGKFWVVPKRNGFDKRASNTWHYTDKRFKKGTGYLLYTFAMGFCKFLQEFGVDAKMNHADYSYQHDAVNSKEVTFNKQLPVGQLKKISLIDLRINKEATLNPLIDELNTIYPEIEILSTSSKISPNSLIVIDYTKEDFQHEESRYYKYGEDIRNVFYRKNPQLVKQSINIESHISDGQLLIDSLLKIKIEVCVNELFWKFMLTNQKPFISEKEAYEIPLFNTKLGKKIRDHAFLYKDKLLYFDGVDMKIADFAQVPFERNNLLNRYGRNWNELYEYFEPQYERQRKKNEDLTIQDVISNKRIIIHEDYIVSIENREERVIYNYDKIKNKIEQNKSARSSSEIAGSRGVYYNQDEQKYFVGGLQPLQYKQENAIMIKRLMHIICTEEENDFDHSWLMETLRVKWVRNKKYTSYPYLFDLISLYEEVNQFIEFDVD